MELLLIVFYFLLLLIICLKSTKWGQNQKHYFLASRSLNTLQLTSTMAATSIGGSAVLLVVGQVFNNGLPFIWTDLAGGAGLVILGWTLAGKVRRTECYSLPEIAGKQFGPLVRTIATILVVIAQLGFLALLLRGCAGILQPVLNISPDLTILIVCVFFILYTILGGQMAIVRTDMVQLVLTFFSLALLLYITFSNATSWSALPQGHFAFPVNQHYSSLNIFSLILIAGLPHVVGSDIFGKILSARNEKTARRGSVYAGLLKISVGVMVGIIGLNAATLLPAETLPDQVITELLQTYAHPVFATLVLVGLLATLMSSADSVLLTTATVISNDLFRHGSDTTSSSYGRAMTLLVGATGVAITLVFPTMLSAFLFAYTLFSGGIVIPVLLGFWKKELKLNQNGAVTGMLASASVIILLSVFNIDSTLITIAGILVNAVLLFLISWITCNSKKEYQ